MASDNSRDMTFSAQKTDKGEVYVEVEFDKLPLVQLLRQLFGNPPAN